MDDREQLLEDEAIVVEVPFPGELAGRVGEAVKA